MSRTKKRSVKRCFRCVSWGGPRINKETKTCALRQSATNKDDSCDFWRLARFVWCEPINGFRFSGFCIGKPERACKRCDVYRVVGGK